MKKKIVKKGFDLNKQTVANLTVFEQEQVMAGNDRCELTECIFSNSAVWFSSSEFVNTQGQVIEMPADKRYWPCYIAPPTH